MAEPATRATTAPAMLDRRARFAALHKRSIAIEIWLNPTTPEEDKMELKELQAMPTDKLLALYNKHSEKKIKAARSREDLIHRTKALLDKASGAPVAPKTKPAGKPGRPARDDSGVTYKAGTATGRLNKGSLRDEVHALVIASKDGMTRAKIEELLPKQPVKGAIDYLVKRKMLVAA